MEMKNVVAYTIAFLFLNSIGCANRSHLISPSDQWRAPNSTLEANLAAAKKLVPVGIRATAARNLLGMDGHLAHYYGPTVAGRKVNGNLSFRKQPDHDWWALEYEVSGGKICLILDWARGNLNLEDAIVKSIKSMKPVPFTETSQEQAD